MTFLLLLAALAAGTANPFQSGTNAELNKQLGTPMWATILVYCSGLAGLLLLQALVRQPLPGTAKMATVPWWAWLGGLVSIISTVVAVMTAQKLGSGVFTGLSITASLVTSVLLDHYGLIGFKQHTASPLRMVGCAIMVAGLWIVART
jgi:transporter family-2 protein